MERREKIKVEEAGMERMSNNRDKSEKEGMTDGSVKKFNGSSKDQRQINKKRTREKKGNRRESVQNTLFRFSAVSAS